MQPTLFQRVAIAVDWIHSSSTTDLMAHLLRATPDTLPFHRIIARETGTCALNRAICLTVTLVAWASTVQGVPPCQLVVPTTKKAAASDVDKTSTTQEVKGAAREWRAAKTTMEKSTSAQPVGTIMLASGLFVVTCVAMM